MASVAYVWAYIITQLFALAMFFAIFDSFVRNQLYDIAVSLGANMTTYGIIMNIWAALPFILSAALLIYGIVYTVRQGREGAYS